MHRTFPQCATVLVAAASLVALYSPATAQSIIVPAERGYYAVEMPLKSKLPLIPAKKLPKGGLWHALHGTITDSGVYVAPHSEVPENLDIITYDSPSSTLDIQIVIKVVSGINNDSAVRYETPAFKQGYLLPCWSLNGTTRITTNRKMAVRRISGPIFPYTGRLSKGDVMEANDPVKIGTGWYAAPPKIGKWQTVRTTLRPTDSKPTQYQAQHRSYSRHGFTDFYRRDGKNWEYLYSQIKTQYAEGMATKPASTAQLTGWPAGGAPNGWVPKGPMIATIHAQPMLKLRRLR